MYLNDYKKSFGQLIHNPISEITLDRIGNLWLYMEPGSKYGYSGQYIAIGYYTPGKEDFESNAWAPISRFLS